MDDIDKAVDELAARGVRFERYDDSGAGREGIFRGEGPYIPLSGTRHERARPPPPIDGHNAEAVCHDPASS